MTEKAEQDYKAWLGKRVDNKENKLSSFPWNHKINIISSYMYINFQKLWQLL